MKLWHKKRFALRLNQTSSHQAIKHIAIKNFENANFHILRKDFLTPRNWFLTRRQSPKLSQSKRLKSFKTLQPRIGSTQAYLKESQTISIY